MRLARGLRTALGLLALYGATTGQVGSCASERSRPMGTIDRSSLPGALRSGGQMTTFNGSFTGAIATRVSVSPSPARLGEAIRYLAVVRAPRSQKVRFDPPQSGGELTWSELRAGRQHPGWWKQSVYEAVDSVWFEARLQVFTTGVVTIPGPLVRLDPAPNSTGPGFTRMPTAHVVILPTVTAADSNQSLRGLHGPLGAPWWERVPLAAIVVGLLLVVAWVVVLQRLRARRKKPVRRVVAPTVAPSRPRIDPAAEALRALFTLRAKKLPAQQRFGEHALELTAILRRFLEVTVTTPRPGDTSGELLERLRASRLEKSDLERLEGLLGLWDRVKFARAPLTEAEAVRCEESVEAYVRRVAQARLEAEAAAARAAAARAATTTTTSDSAGGKPPADPKSKPPADPKSRPPADPKSKPPSRPDGGTPSGTTPRPSGTLSRPASGTASRPAAGSGGASPSRSGPRPPAPEAA